MLKRRASSRVARLSSHRTMAADAKVPDRECVVMFISCGDEDDPAASAIRLPPT
jgi:hypothetical protein